MTLQLYEIDEYFRKLMNELNEKFKRRLQFSVLEELYKSENKGKSFDDIKYTHPAIFMVEYAMAKLLEHNGIHPDTVIGSSIGEMTALVIAGSLSCDEAIELICRQIYILEDVSANGAMIAVLDKTENYIKDDYIKQVSYLASVSYNKHFVISCENSKLSEICSYLKENNISHQVLPVKYGFHSSLVDDIYARYIDESQNILIKSPKINYISAMDSKEKVNVTEKGYLARVIKEPMNLEKALQQIPKIHTELFVDISPMGSLISMVKRAALNIQKEKCFQVLWGFQTEYEHFCKVTNEIKELNILKSKGEKRMKVYVFPGQGSQEKGMGEDLFERYPTYVRIADEVLGYSIKELCLENPDGRLDVTKYTQPALYVIEALEYLKKVEDTQEKPDYVLGHSLGEYPALFAAGAFDFHTGLELVKLRGQLMYEAGNGGMAAVVGLTREEVAEILQNNRIIDIDIANINTPSQIAIAGPNESIEAAKPIFEASGARRYIILKVSGAFHSRYMSKAAERFEEFIVTKTISKPKTPIISNYTARPYESFELVENLIKQINNPVKWVESIEYLMGKGTAEYEQIGPGQAAVNMVMAITKAGKAIYADEESEIAARKQALIPNEIPNVEVLPKTKEFVEEKKEEMKIEETEEIRIEKESNIEKDSFCKRYGLFYPYVAGSMGNGISAANLVVRMAQKHLLAFIGTNGSFYDTIASTVREVRNALTKKQLFGIGLCPGEKEKKLIELCLAEEIPVIECASYINVSKELVYYKIKGMKKLENGEVFFQNRILVKLSRPEVLRNFISPVPTRLIEELYAEGRITMHEAQLIKNHPTADDVCILTDPAGQTEQYSMISALPTMLEIRDEFKKKYDYSEYIHIGTGGEIGTPKAIAAAFLLGAEFVLTGSINQCTVEAQTSELVKDMLQKVEIQDTNIVMANDFSGLSIKANVLRKGTLYCARANKLYELYRTYNRLEEISPQEREHIENNYFKTSFSEILGEMEDDNDTKTITSNKAQLMKVLRWYEKNACKWAIEGNKENKVNFLIYTSRSIGAFNNWVKWTELESWRNRHVDEIAIKLMKDAKEYLTQIKI